METRAYYNTRKPYTPRHGLIYSNQGGGEFVCLSWGDAGNTAVMQNTKSGWCFVAHGVGMYEDGRIDWDFSTDGEFSPVDLSGTQRYTVRHGMRWTI